MTLDSLIARCRELRITLRPERGHLVIGNFSSEGLPGDLRKEIWQHKADLLALLEKDALPELSPWWSRIKSAGKKRSGENWEEFSNWLLQFRDQLLGQYEEYFFQRDPSYPNPYPGNWVDEKKAEERIAQLYELDWREGKLWYERAKAAWLHLGTPANRKRALVFLHEAFQEAFQEVCNGSQFWKVTKSERIARSKALQSVRGQAEQKVQEAIEALTLYRRKAMSNESYPRPMYIEFQRFPRPRPFAHEASDEILKCLEELRSLAERLQQVKSPLLLAKEPKQRGRRKKPALNEALQNLSALFSGRKSSEHGAVRHAHSLLYVAGVVVNKHLRGWLAKVAQLRKRAA